MAAPIRGMRPYDAGGNDYVFATSGRHFRQRPTRGNTIPVRRRLTLPNDMGETDADAARTTYIPLRKPKDARTGPRMEQMPAWLVRAVLGGPIQPQEARRMVTSITYKRGRHAQAPALAIRGG